MLVMSRTRRNRHYNKCALKQPKTYNEIKGLDRVRTGDYLDIDQRISTRNRKPPTSWDDKVVSSYYQCDYNKPH
jgi:hypothetical protein